MFPIVPSDLTKKKKNMLSAISRKWSPTSYETNKLGCSPLRFFWDPNLDALYVYVLRILYIIYTQITYEYFANSSRSTEYKDIQFVFSLPSTSHLPSIPGTGRSQLELWVSPSQKKTFPVFLEENSIPRKSGKRFRTGWFREIGDLAWVCSTSNDWHSMQNNALCCHPLGDQHPDHVIEVIAHHPIQPSGHQPWCDQKRSHIISNHVTSCHIVSRDIMTCHLISFYFIQPWQVAPPASVIKCLVGCTGCPFIPRFLKSEPRISSTTSRQPGCSVSACSG